MAAPPNGVPFLVYRAGAIGVGTLPIQTIEVNIATVFTLDVRGATGNLTLESLLGDGTGAAALPYSLSSDGLPVVSTGLLTFTGGERLYVNVTCSLVRITGTVTTGALQLIYTGWPSLPPGAAVPMNVAVNGAFANPLNPLPVAQS